MSTGLLLVVAGVLLPLLVWRDSQWILIPVDSLDSLTPLAREVIHQRQRVLQRVGELVGFASVGLVLGGLSLTVWGAVRLLHRQRKDDEAADAQTGKAVYEFRTLTAEEQRRSAEADAAQIEEEQRVQNLDGADRPGGPPSDGTSLPDSASSALVNRVQEVERVVLDRIEQAARGRLRLRRHVLFRGFEIDGYLRPVVRALPNVIIEIKFSRGQPQRRARDAQAQLERILSQFVVAGSGAVGWAVIVTDREVVPSFQGPGPDGPPIWITYVLESELPVWAPDLAMLVTKGQ